MKQPTLQRWRVVLLICATFLSCASCANDNTVHANDDNPNSGEHPPHMPFDDGLQSFEERAIDSTGNNSTRTWLTSQPIQDPLERSVVNMFLHGYNNYMKYAFPAGELKPVSCSSQHASYGKGLPYTLLDSLDTLLAFGFVDEFETNLIWLFDNVKDFDIDHNVSVFETNIRALGGLLSVHLMLDPKFNRDVKIPGAPYPLQLTRFKYSGQLLDLAVDLADRLLPAFDTPTGIPFGTVNLRYGVPKNESNLTCTASATTFSLEFGLLSRLTNNSIYDAAARRAVRAVYQSRSSIGLVGNHIDISKGRWVLIDSGVGMGVDSYYEYLLKAALLFNDAEYMSYFVVSYSAVINYIKYGNWFLDVNMNTAVPTLLWYDSMASFIPSLQVLLGDLQPAFSEAKDYFKIWRQNRMTPEKLIVTTGYIPTSKAGWPQRPEMVEGVWYVGRASGLDWDRDWATQIVADIEHFSRVECGYKVINDVTTLQFDDRMESYFLAETVKYLYLIAQKKHWLNTGNFIFSTEAHPFPFSHEFSKPFDHGLPAVEGFKTQFHCPIEPAIHIRGLTALESEPFSARDLQRCEVFLFETPQQPGRIEVYLHNVTRNNFEEVGSYLALPRVLSTEPSESWYRWSLLVKEYTQIKNELLAEKQQKRAQRIDKSKLIEAGDFEDEDEDEEDEEADNQNDDEVLES